MHPHAMGSRRHGLTGSITTTNVGAGFRQTERRHRSATTGLGDQARVACSRWHLHGGVGAPIGQSTHCASAPRFRWAKGQASGVFVERASVGEINCLQKSIHQRVPLVVQPITGSTGAHSMIRDATHGCARSCNHLQLVQQVRLY